MAEDREPREKALARLNEMELSPTNSHVRAAAKRLGFKPETLIKRTEEAFPSKFEQRVYVIVSHIWKRAVHPETISACFRYFSSGQELHPYDFREKGKGNRVLENTAQTLLLISRGFVSKDVAMRFVERFGDRTEEVYNLIGENLQTLMRRLGMRTRTASSQAMMAILYAIAYADEENPDALGLDIVTVDDVEMVLGHFMEWPEGDERDIEAIGRTEEDPYEYGSDI